MPLRKKVVIEIMTSVGENHRSKSSTDHISMHSKGVEFLGEVGHRESREIMATIEDLQHSQATMWVEF